MIFDKWTKITAAIAAFLIGALGLYVVYALLVGTYSASILPSSNVIYNTILAISILLLSIASFMASGALYKYYGSKRELTISRDTFFYAGLGFLGSAFSTLLSMISVFIEGMFSQTWNVQNLFLLIVATLTSLVVGKLLLNEAFKLKPHERATPHVLRKIGFKVR